MSPLLGMGQRGRNPGWIEEEGRRMTVAAFDLGRYLANSKKLEVDDLDWASIKDYPLSAEEIRALTYDMDIESNTIIYVRELLSTPAAEDPEITAFLSCWAYEEFFHGSMIKRFLSEYGVEFPENRMSLVVRERSLGYRLMQVGQSLLSKVMGKRFVTLHMTWGAIAELVTLTGYNLMAERTEHPVLRELLRRIVKDERRHFSFYFNQAKRRLADPTDRRLTAFFVDRFWDVVGAGEVPDSEVDFLVEHLLDTSDGPKTIDYLQKTIRTLPGLEAWNGVERVVARSAARGAHRSEGQAPAPVDADRHRGLSFG